MLENKGFTRTRGGIDDHVVLRAQEVDRLLLPEIRHGQSCFECIHETRFNGKTGAVKSGGIYFEPLIT